MHDCYCPLLLPSILQVISIRDDAFYVFWQGQDKLPLNTIAQQFLFTGCVKPPLNIRSTSFLSEANLDENMSLILFGHISSMKWISF